MDGMKRLLLLLGCSGALLCGADLAGVRTVYVMPMSRGLDQYLANRISNKGLFQVVTDPKLADAVFTDVIGDSFQSQLENIFPTPKPEVKKEAKPAEAAGAAKTDKPAASEKAEAPAKRAKASDLDSVENPMFQDTVNHLETVPSTFGRGKGTIFLVDAKSRQVVWSTFDPSKGTRNHDLDRTAFDIVSRLKKDLTSAQKVKMPKASKPEKPVKPEKPEKAPAPQK